MKHQSPSIILRKRKSELIHVKLWMTIDKFSSTPFPTPSPYATATLAEHVHFKKRVC